MIVGVLGAGGKRAREDSHIGSRRINNLLISMLIIFNRKDRQMWNPHTQADNGGQREPSAGMPGQNGA